MRPRWRCGPTGPALSSRLCLGRRSRDEPAPTLATTIWKRVPPSLRSPSTMICPDDHRNDGRWPKIGHRFIFTYGFSFSAGVSTSTCHSVSLMLERTLIWPTESPNWTLWASEPIDAMTLRDGPLAGGATGGAVIYASLVNFNIRCRSDGFGTVFAPARYGVKRARGSLISNSDHIPGRC